MALFSPDTLVTLRGIMRAFYTPCTRIPALVEHPNGRICPMCKRSSICEKCGTPLGGMEVVVPFLEINVSIGIFFILVFSCFWFWINAFQYSMMFVVWILEISAVFRIFNKIFEKVFVVFWENVFGIYNMSGATSSNLFIARLKEVVLVLSLLSYAQIAQSSLGLTHSVMAKRPLLLFSLQHMWSLACMLEYAVQVSANAVGPSPWGRRPEP